MVNILLAEILKLKRSKILLLIPLGGLIPVLLMLLVYMDSQASSIIKTYVFGWEYFLDVTLYYANITCPAFFAILAGYIFTREYQLLTINSLFTYSFSRMKIFTAKMIIIIILMTVTFLLTIFFTMIFGLLLTKNRLLPDTLLDFVKINIEMVFINILLIFLAVLVSILVKNIIAPIVLGIIYIFGYAVLNRSFSVYVPSCLSSLFATYFTSQLGKNHPVMTHFELLPDIGTAFHTLIIVSSVSFIACIIYYRYSDVG
jgi:hypothetical protein